MESMEKLVQTERNLTSRIRSICLFVFYTFPSMDLLHCLSHFPRHTFVTPGFLFLDLLSRTNGFEHNFSYEADCISAYCSFFERYRVTTLHFSLSNLFYYFHRYLFTTYGYMFTFNVVYGEPMIWNSNCLLKLILKVYFSSRFLKLHK